MDDDVRAVRTLILILLVSGGVRLGWQARTGVDSGGIGSPVELSELVDSATKVEEDEARRSTPLGPNERLDLNIASATELDRLPGVGPSTAERIVAARAERPFGAVDDLGRVSGIGPTTLERLRSHLVVTRGRSVTASSAAARRRATSSGRGAGPTGAATGSTTAHALNAVDPNLAPAEALQRLPGIGPFLAERWISHRTTSGPFRTPEDLLEISGVGPATLERLRPWLISVPWAARVARD